MSNYEALIGIVFELCVILAFIAADEILSKRKQPTLHASPSKG